MHVWHSDEIRSKIGNYFVQKVLSEDFVDSNGKAYKFTKDMQAVWPNKSFKYQITEALLSGTFSMSDGKTNYIIELVSGKLNFYEATTREKQSEADSGLDKGNLLFQLSKK